MFWFYSHPAVYIMVLPAMGIISEVIPVFSRKPIFGYKAIAYSTVAIACLGFAIWAHHMFTTGLAPALKLFFMVCDDGHRRADRGEDLQLDLHHDRRLAAL